MKFIHLADLHLGRRINAYSLLEEQADILQKIIDIIAEEKPDFVLIAGDVYDKAVPPVDAVTLLDSFLNRVVALGAGVYLIAGNHDAAERVSFGASLMDRSGVHVAPVFDGTVRKYTETDDFGDTDIYLMPFLRPAEVRHIMQEEEITDTAHAVAAVIRNLPLDPEKRNIIVSHQFVAGGTVCDSEIHSVGGTDSVPYEVYAPFDYAALGHLHGAQHIGRESLRYSGTPLKYSMSEVSQSKSVTVVELGKKGDAPVITERPLVPMRDMRQLRGYYDALIRDTSDDYVSIVLRDEIPIPDAMQNLRLYYPHILSMCYESEITDPDYEEISMELPEERSPFAMFDAFFTQMRGREMTDEQKKYMQELIGSIWTEEGGA